MKLVFFREENEIKLKLNHEGNDEEFNYVRLIKFLHENNELETTEYDDDISEDEKGKINDMIQKINQTVVQLTVE